jgi:hypothetical protein
MSPITRNNRSFAPMTRCSPGPVTVDESVTVVVIAAR